MGSEMCIRDRPNKDDVKRDQAVGGAAANVPVSFTAAQFNLLLESMQAPARLMQQALDVLAAQGGQQVPQAPPAGGAAAAAAPVRAGSVFPAERLTLKMPMFYEDKLELWFSLIEGHFEETNKTAEKARFRSVVPLLTTKAVTHAESILLEPPEDAYTQLKANLIRRFRRHKLDMLCEMRDIKSLGDRSPLQMLAHLRSLSPDHQDCPIIEMFFLDLLPESVRRSLGGLESLDEKASKAEEMLPPLPSGHQSACGRRRDLRRFCSCLEKLKLTTLNKSSEF